MDIIKYKGYEGSVEYSAEDDCLVGKILHTKKANIGYCGDSVEEIKKMFYQAVDEYLNLCEEKGWEPEKPEQENFLLTLSRDLLQKITKSASSAGISPNDFIISAIKKAI